MYGIIIFVAIDPGGGRNLFTYSPGKLFLLD